jgi:hypothetical protein
VSTGLDQTLIDSSTPEALDRLLSNSPPFGDSEYVLSQMHAAFQRRLGRVASALPVAADLLDALNEADLQRRYYVYGDPVLRSAIQHALRQVVMGEPYGLPIAECSEIFRTALTQFDRYTQQGPLALDGPPLDRIGTAGHHGAVWSDDGSDRIFRRTFRYLVLNNFDDPVGSPNEAALWAIRRGVQLLEAILPNVARSALSHAPVIAIFPSTGRWSGMASGSQFRVAGTVFLQQDCLDNPWWLAEHLLHEALHHKLYDIRHAHSLLTADSMSPKEARGEDEEQRIESIWNASGDARNSNLWSASRALAAFHVYAHLALLALVAERLEHNLEGEYGPRSASAAGLTDSRTALERAHYLGSALKKFCWEELGLAGRNIICWLTEFLSVLGPRPHEELLITNLTLQRYRRECARIQDLQASTNARQDQRGTDIASQIHTMLTDELASAGQILESLGKSQLLYGLQNQVRKMPEGSEFVDAFEVRREIADSLSRALTAPADRPPDASETPQITAARGAVRSMIDDSSRRLRELISRMPPVVVSSDQAGLNAGLVFPGVDLHAELVRLTATLGRPYGTDKLSLFLHAYSRVQVPHVIVELGTGCGASALAMASAAKLNAVGHVWTIDDQEHRSEFARVLEDLGNRLDGPVWHDLQATRPDRVLDELANRLRLTDWITFLTGRMVPEKEGHFSSYPFERPVDLLFSDFDHRPTAILQILAQFLPVMASASSVFIHSASTQWSAYLLLENLVAQMNRGLVPSVLQSQASVDLLPVVKNRRVTLVHLTEPDRSVQNSVAWLKLEPVDLLPHPTTSMRGIAL